MDEINMDGWLFIQEYHQQSNLCLLCPNLSSSVRFQSRTMGTKMRGKETHHSCRHIDVSFLVVMQIKYLVQVDTTKIKILQIHLWYIYLQRKAMQCNQWLTKRQLTTSIIIYNHKTSAAFDILCHVDREFIKRQQLNMLSLCHLQKEICTEIASNQ